VTDGVYVPGVPQGVRPVGRLYVLALPYAGPPPGLSANYRGHWRPKHEATAQLRRDVYFIARQAGLHLLTDVKHVTVELVWNPGTRRRRDADNIYPFLKVAADGLARGRRDWVGLDLVPDDVPEYMTKLAPRIVYGPRERRGMWLNVWVKR
jgi:crossover junction endodeoxyribonuclease RusA